MVSLSLLIRYFRFKVILLLHHFIAWWYASLFFVSLEYSTYAKMDTVTEYYKFYANIEDVTVGTVIIHYLRILEMDSFSILQNSV